MAPDRQARDQGGRADAPAAGGSDAGRAAELRAAAAAKRAELKASAAAKGSELAHSAALTAAAQKGTELAHSAALRTAEVRRQVRKMDVPWARCAPARLARETILQAGLGPIIDLYARQRVTGHEHFAEIPHPVILVANHASHLDTPMILRALPRKWRQRTAVGAAADYFYKSRALANAVALAFNTVPILRRGGGMNDGSFDHVDKLLEQDWNLLIYPEGTRSRRGELGRLRSGAAVIARRHGLPIVPVRVRGTHDAMPPGRVWPRRSKGVFSRRHCIEVSFGEPIWPDDYEEHGELMERLRPFLAGDETPVPAVPDGSRQATGRRPVTPAL